ncbi:tetratricopeptide repeat protein [Kitasatospora kifunensis]|uniref:Tetratricopeptide (TPR) repeat protein n=1 Tax=Kitasatospora kifunensis TaxID=58351 RepID=A0A7W7QYJ2_KITKI|nr:tetratricopeptide repeat protein [Kitasatospora kifunensis]MBB4921893.1 tetratricopeptide (TPR) repeat protein [Kitasatospora kifunensis]
MSQGIEGERGASGPRIEGEASGQGRVYQAVGDQLITEHHHYYASPEPLTRLPVGPASIGAPVRWPGPDTVRVPLAERPPRVLRDRHDLMRELRLPRVGGDGDIHLLHGMGGSGKTAVAYTLFQESVGNGRIGLWVNASDRMTLRAGMLAVAADRGAETGELVAAHSGQRAAADLVWHYLDHSAQPWLLVIDNADDPAILDEGGWLRASPMGTVLVTSRHATSPLWRSAVRHKIDVLPLEDAAQVLCDFAPDAGSHREAEQVARTLGCLPLALTLAGSYLAHQLLESWTMSEYDERLHEESTDLIDQGAAPGTATRGHRQLVSRTWQITLDALAERGLPQVTTLLRLLSCWGPEPLPLAVLARTAVDDTSLDHADPALDSTQLEPALRALLDHSLSSLIEVPGGEGAQPTRCIQSHGVLLDSVATATPPQQQQRLMEAAIHLLNSALPDETSPGAGKERLRLLAPHATALLRRATPETASEVTRLAVRVAAQIYEAGDYEAALALAKAAAETAQRLQGPDHPDTLAARHQAGDALRRLGRIQEAEDLLRTVLTDRERVLGPDHPDTLLTSAALAIPLFLLSRYPESLAYLQRAIVGQQHALGEEHPETLRSRALILEILAQAGELEEFLRTGPETVADCERLLGPDHPVTGIAYSNYAYGLLHAGSPQDAVAAAQRALDGRIRVLGPEHPLVYSAKLVLSWALMLSGSHEEAVRLMREAVEGRERLLGEDHPLAVKARVLLAERLAAAGNLDEAQLLLSQNLADCVRLYGPDDSDVKRVRLLLAL